MLHAKLLASTILAGHVRWNGPGMSTRLSMAPIPCLEATDSIRLEAQQLDRIPKIRLRLRPAASAPVVALASPRLDSSNLSVTVAVAAVAGC